MHKHGVLVIANDTKRLCCWLGAVLVDGWDGCVCVRLVRTERKSLARVLTPSALD
eukprot:COSAG06_NODE_50509_length_318_cov_0.730594_1_plen_54_part_10